MDDRKRAVATGGCQCGKVRYALYVAPENSHVCHCRMCQRATGGLLAALAGAPKDAFAWTRGEPGVFASSNLATRAYCRDCGTPLSFSYNQPEARFYVTIGSLDDPESAPIIMQYGVESKLGWVKFCEEVASERTGEDPKAAAFFGGMENNQS
ncbi:MAG: GFA family protein [Hyphomonadaceae bacterium]